MYGGLSLTGDGFEVRNFGTVRAAKLLALLSLARTGRVHREQLAEHLWPDDFYDATRLRLRQELHRLKRALGPASEIVGSSPSDVWLDVSSIETDLTVLENPSAVLGGADWHRLLEQPFLPGWDDEWVRAERNRAESSLLRAAVRQGHALLEGGDPAAALALAKGLIATHPLHEDLRMLAVAAHSKLGSVAAALAEYQEFRRRVKEQLGAEPSAASQSKLQELVAAPPTTHAFDWTHTVPTPVEPLIGRDELVQRVLKSLAPPSSSRWVTLIGPGGIGKTRLAVEVVQHLRASDTRIAFVTLDEVAEPSEWARAVAAQLRAEPPMEADPAHYLASILGQSPTLLVLDNLETVLPLAAPRLAAMMAEVPSLRVLATSVTPIRLAGESLVAVGTLDPATDGVSVLREVWRSVRPNASQEGFDDELRTIAERLDGYPLALRLAGARLRLLAPKELLGQLESAVSGGSAQLPERHRSLESALASSYESLDEEQRRVLAAIACLPGGVGMNLAGTLFADKPYLDLIESLLDASLIVLDDNQVPVLLRTLAPIRRHVQSRWSDEERSAQEAQVARAFLNWLERFDVAPWTAVSRETLNQLDVEADNIRFVWDWAWENEPRSAYRLAPLIVRYDSARGRAMLLLDKLMPLRERWSNESPSICAHMELTLAFLLFACHREELSLEPLQAAERLAKELGDAAMRTRVALGMAMYAFRRDFWKAEELGLEALDWATRVGDAYCIARAHRTLGSVANHSVLHEKAIKHVSIAYQGLTECGVEVEAATAGAFLAGHLWVVGRVEEATEILERAKAALDPARDVLAWANLVEIEGKLAFHEGRPAEAEPYFRETLRIWKSVGCPYQEGDQNHMLAHALLRQGRVAEARRYLIDAADSWYKDNNIGGTYCSLIMVAEILWMDGKGRQARELMGYVEALRTHHALAIVESAFKHRDAVLELIGGPAESSAPLTLDAARAQFDQIR